jgi:hypothetical protein
MGNLDHDGKYFRAVGRYQILNQGVITLLEQVNRLGRPLIQIRLGLASND